MPIIQKNQSQLMKLATRPRLVLANFHELPDTLLSHLKHHFEILFSNTFPLSEELKVGFAPEIILAKSSPEDSKPQADLIKEITGGLVLVLMVEGESQLSVIEAVANGADDALLSTATDEEVLVCLKKSLERRKSLPVSTSQKHSRSRQVTFSGIIAANTEMRSIFETIEKISEFSTTILIQGESGTGKELIAKAIHNNSPRSKKPFVPVNCGAIPENLLESELFGHRKGAFTDATKDKKGLFEEAHGGTILLDEIGELPVHLQVKLLRVLQEGELRRVGDVNPIPIDVRVIGATLRDLEADVLEGRFRDDLYYRLNVITIRVPPLRERKDDIPLLVDFFLKKNHEKLGLPQYSVSEQAMNLLLAHDWPGNIRELENCIERAMIMCEGKEIVVENLPRSVSSKKRETSNFEITSNSLSIKEHVRSVEESLIRKALEKTAGNRTHAAKLLEISHRTLLYKLKEYGLAESDKD